MKQKLLIFICYILGLSGFSQEINVDYVGEINQKLFDVGDNHIYPESLSLLQSFASQGDPNYSNLLGLLYREGLGVEKNQKKAFEYIMNSAKKEFAPAEFNVGRFYMIGLGCDIDFDKAIYWLTKASNNGNGRAAYALGYMYFKGFGVKQDYKKAISWFEVSSWPMSKHYLGICNYFGYGVEKNEDQAKSYFLQSKTANSGMFLRHINENVKENLEKNLALQINEKVTKSNTGIEKEIIDKTTVSSKLTSIADRKKELKTKYFNGKWKGKLIELDWSGKQITNIQPLIIEFAGDGKSLNYKLEINNEVSQSIAILEDNALYFDKQYLNFTLPYAENPDSNLIEWQLLSSDMEFKTINKNTYLTGSLKTFSNEWKESGPPMQIILKQTEEDEGDLTEDEILALSQQKENFISLYPNPFENNVLIEYELESDAEVNVVVYDLSGNAASVTLEQGNVQTQGKHKYTFDGSNLRPGMYIVRVGVGKIVHSRILIKN